MLAANGAWGLAASLFGVTLVKLGESFPPVRNIGSNRVIFPTPYSPSLKLMGYFRFRCTLENHSFLSHLDPPLSWMNEFPRKYRLTVVILS